MSNLQDSSPNPNRNKASDAPAGDGGDGKAQNHSQVKDWRRVPFVLVDSPHTKRYEDAVAVRSFPGSRSDINNDHWSADLKVIHPLPITEFVSLREGVNQVCLGIHESINARGEVVPKVAFVQARRLTCITDLQANLILDYHKQEARRRASGNDIQKQLARTIASPQKKDPDILKRLTVQLHLVRATALRVSPWRNREFSAEHSVGILLTHVQSSAIQASRSLRACPSLIVLRPEGSRILTRETARRELGFDTRDASVRLSAGRDVPTVLRPEDEPQQHDKLRLKERGNSGAINITQIACALLGIRPLPEELIKKGLRPDGTLDNWKHGGRLPEELCKAIAEKRREIWAALAKLVGERLWATTCNDE